MQDNPYASVPEDMAVTAAAASFVETVTYKDIPEDAIHLGMRCVLDGMGLFVSGADEPTVRILAEDARQQGGNPEARLLGCGDARVPAALAARVLGTSGHAHDWDDCQVSEDPDHVYGLLTHPTIAPLSAAIAVTQKIAGVTGKDFLLGFLTGFEVECKISEWMLSQHYKSGKHSSGTVGTFGAYAAAAKLLGLTGDALRWGFGISASMASGIRVNFGTMTKPFHVGRAAENGVTAATLASFTKRTAWRTVSSGVTWKLPNGISAMIGTPGCARATALQWCTMSSMVTGSVLSLPCSTMPSESPTKITSIPEASTSPAKVAS